MMIKGDDDEPAAEAESPWVVFRTKYPFLTDHINLIKKTYRELRMKQIVVTPFSTWYALA
jgi:hypothetical protein